MSQIVTDGSTEKNLSNCEDAKGAKEKQGASFAFLASLR
jgi:hypothetical protein